MRDAPTTSPGGDGGAFPRLAHDGRLPSGGWVHRQDTDELRLYYGAADTCIAMARSTLREVLDFVMAAG